ncbi:hypothetical protein DPEC_G00318330, partial [Dallia pectoralis]
IPVLLSSADDVQFGVDPVQLFIQRVVVNSPDVPQVVDGKDDVRRLLLIHHHPVNG